MSGQVIWITGLSEAGKTTLANKLQGYCWAMWSANCWDSV